MFFKRDYRLIVNNENTTTFGVIKQIEVEKFLFSIVAYTSLPTEKI